MLEKLSRIKEKHYLLILALIWIGVQLIMYSIFGFKTGWEGGKYQDDARLFLETGHLNPVRLFFSSYSLLIAFFIKTGIGLKGVLLFQLLYSFFTVYIFFKLVKKLTNNNITAFLSTLIFIVTPNIQMWNFHLFTESIFINSLVIFLFLILNFRGKVSEFVVILLLAVVISYQRPPGVAAILPAAIFLILSGKGKKKKLLLALFLLAFFFIHIYVMLSNTTNFDEFFFATKNQYSLIGGYNALPRQQSFAANLIVFIKALVIKFFYLFSMWRPYFSIKHNLVQLSFLPLYFFAIIGFISLYKENKRMFIYLFLLVAGYSALFVFTYVNYHCRYVTTVLPFVILLAACGIKRIFFSPKTQKNKS